jgi:NifU-like protein involved in Fe-S cluster formation
MASAAVLYTPEVLGLATGLSAYRLDDDLPLRSEARSRSCGSTLTLGMSVSDSGLIERIGLRSQACAIGQASATVFAQAAVGRNVQDVVDTAEAVALWLGSGGDLPTWPGFTALAAARDYPGRHGALMLPWTAALQLLSSSDRGS